MCRLYPVFETMKGRVRAAHIILQTLHREGLAVSPAEPEAHTAAREAQQKPLWYRRVLFCAYADAPGTDAHTLLPARLPGS